MKAAFLATSVVAMKHPVREEVVAEVLAKTKSWTPMPVEQNKFRHSSPKQLKASLGAMDFQYNREKAESKGYFADLAAKFMKKNPLIPKMLRQEKSEEEISDKKKSGVLPQDFDAREAWPMCKSEVRN